MWWLVMSTFFMVILFYRLARARTPMSTLSSQRIRGLSKVSCNAELVATDNAQKQGQRIFDE